MWHSAAAWPRVRRRRGTALLLHDARAYGAEPFPQVARVHPCGGTDGLKVLLVVKKKFFRYAAVAQWAANPLFEGLCNDGPPEPFLRGSAFLILKDGAFKHESPWTVLHPRTY